jgi:hypothetical protein
VPFDLAPEDWTAVLRGVVRSEYSLLLGAGASLDSHRSSGEHVPGVRRLVRELVELFSIPTDPATLSLARAYEASQGRKTQQGQTVYEYLHSEFTDTAPADWYENLCNLRWNTIWTLNIDDVVEAAYSRCALTREQTAVSLSWCDRFKRPRAARNEVQVVHLHGAANRLNEAADDQLIFAILEYLRAAEHRHAWHHVFSDDFQGEPFIVVGASLAEEFDLAEILRRTNNSAEMLGRPSLIVLPDFDALQTEEFIQWGLTPVRASAAEFFSVLAVDVRHYQAEFAALTPGHKNQIPNEAVRFLTQFQSLRAPASERRPSRHDLYAGHEPEWSDITDDRDARFGIGRLIQSNVEKHLDEAVPGVRLIAVTGAPFVGKSVVLLRVARELLRRDVDVYMFSADDRLDIDAAVWWIKNAGRCVLVFDGLADHSPDLARLAHECEAAEAPCVVLGAERISRRSILYSNLPIEVMSDDDIFEMGSLSDSDIKALVGKLATRRRLGLISRHSRADQEEYFRSTAGRSLAEGMAALESGRGFVDRLRAQYENIESPSSRKAYTMACIAYAFGYGVPAAILAASSGMTTSELIGQCRPDGPLGEVLRVQGRNIRPRHRRLASLVVESVMTSTERYELTQRLARNLAPYITPETVTQRVLPYRIARELLNNRVISDWIPDDAWDRWYEELGDVYDWNARYWEQRALSAARRRDFDKAESFAEHAVKLYRDSFTLTTLGSVLIRKASQWAQPLSHASYDYFDRAVAALEQAREREGGREEPPFLAFFDGTLELVRRGKPREDDVRFGLLVQTWERWHADARNLPLYQREETRRELVVRQRRWQELRAATPGS